MLKSERIKGDLPEKKIKKTIGVEQALQKIKHYCAYQERSHYETREKLYALGLHKTDVENTLTYLITEDYLNEERFASSYARGKFNLKRWGRVKIKYALKQLKVSDYNIKTALKEIDEAGYINTLEKLARDKWDSLQEEQHLARQAKTIAYLQQKGYELPLVQKAVNKVKAEP